MVRIATELLNCSRAHSDTAYDRLCTRHPSTSFSYKVQMCPLMGRIGYRAFCSRPEWAQMRTFFNFRTRCRNGAEGYHSLERCNNVYECPDRSDEAAGCSSRQRGGECGNTYVCGLFR